ncbi:MAG: terminase small subunit [Sulfurimonas sp.]
MQNLHKESYLLLNGSVKQLTIKQEKFIRKYFECGNATEAYKYAYSTQNQKDKTINENASRLVNDSKIIARLNELRTDAETESKYSREKVLDDFARVIKVGFGDVESPHIITEGQGKGETYTQTLDLKDTNLAAVNSALTNIAKILGLFEKDNQQKDGIDLGAIAKKVFESQRGN